MNAHDLEKTLATEIQKMPGSDLLSEVELVSLARRASSSKKYCIVQDWYYVDVELGTDEIAMLEQRDWKPSILLASTVVSDESGRFLSGNGVKS